MVREEPASNQQVLDSRLHLSQKLEVVAGPCITTSSYKPCLTVRMQLQIYFLTAHTSPGLHIVSCHHSTSLTTVWCNLQCTEDNKEGMVSDESTCANITIQGDLEVGNRYDKGQNMAEE